MIRVVFMGTPAYATTILKALIESSDIEVVALFCQPDKPVGRKQTLTPPDSKNFILQNSIDINIFQPPTLKDISTIEKIKSLNPDFIVVAAYGKILPKSILDIAPCINLHASLLPKYRGASPIQDSILNRDILSGVSAMIMQEELDVGDVLAKSYLNIQNLSAIELFTSLSHMAADLTLNVIRDFDLIYHQKQNELQTSYSKKITKGDGLVNFVDAKDLYAKYLAYIHWPGIYLKSGLKLKELNIFESDSTNIAGDILDIEAEHIVVGCTRGSLKIKSVQAPSKKAINSVDYIRGKRLGIGDNLS
jgi:methionyl-tRNA formyltransferase